MTLQNILKHKEPVNCHANSKSVY